MLSTVLFVCGMATTAFAACPVIPSLDVFDVPPVSEDMSCIPTFLTIILVMYLEEQMDFMTFHFEFKVFREA